MPEPKIQTKDGMVLNAFYLYATEGLPLSLQWELAAKKGYIISLTSFHQDALQAGWTDKKVESYMRDELVG